VYPSKPVGDKARQQRPVRRLRHDLKTVGNRPDFAKLGNPDRSFWLNENKSVAILKIIFEKNLKTVKQKKLSAKQKKTEP
jgi:hypothetical protein